MRREYIEICASSPTEKKETGCDKFDSVTNSQTDVKSPFHGRGSAGKLSWCADGGVVVRKLLNVCGVPCDSKKNADNQQVMFSLGSEVIKTSPGAASQLEWARWSVRQGSKACVNLFFAQSCQPLQRARPWLRDYLWW